MSREKYTIEDCIKLAKERGGECLSDKYVNMRINMLWKCSYGHEWPATFGSIKSNKTWCKICYHNSRRKYRLEDCQKAAQERGGKCLSEKYISSDISMEWECKNGHRWKTRFDNIINANHWCSKCQMHSIEYCQKVAQDQGGKCLSTTYINTSTPMTWECKDGHVWNNTFGNVLHQNNWCKVCAGLEKHTLEKCQKVAMKRNGECLSETYVNLSEEMLWRCEYGHVWKATFREINCNYSWCPDCSESCGEQMIRRVLNSLNITFESQKKFNDLKVKDKLSYDFYVEINDIKICIEYDGMQHYKPISLFGGEPQFARQRIHDELKTNYCISNNINLIRIKYNSKNQEEILSEKINSVIYGNQILDRIVIES